MSEPSTFALRRAVLAIITDWAEREHAAMPVDFAGSTVVAFGDCQECHDTIAVDFHLLAERIVAEIEAGRLLPRARQGVPT